MIIQLKEEVKKKDKDQIKNVVESIGYKSTEVKTNKASYMACIGKEDFDIRLIGNLKGVKDVHRVSDDYKFVSRKWKVESTKIDLKDGINIGDGNMSIMAGPCSIESEEQVTKLVSHLKKHNIRIMRGGVFKPRSSPYSFRGLGIEGLKMFSTVCREHNIRIITEVMEISQISKMYDYIDIFQVGARNTQNFNLLNELGKTNKPVLLKRGLSGTLNELLQSAEYIFSSGNEQIILCERGIRTYEKAYRNTLDLNAVPILKQKTHLPVIVDPSHGIGLRDFVEPMALAGIMAGADGLLLEVHEKPEKALSDGQQSLNLQESAYLFNKALQAFQLRNSF